MRDRAADGGGRARRGDKKETRREEGRKEMVLGERERDSEEEEGRGEKLKRLSEREGPVERRKSGAWWQRGQRTKEDEGV